MKRRSKILEESYACECGMLRVQDVCTYCDHVLCHICERRSFLFLCNMQSCDSESRSIFLETCPLTYLLSENAVCVRYGMFLEKNTLCRRKSFSADTSPATEYLSSFGCLHSLAKPTCFLSLNFTWLVCSFHDNFFCFLFLERSYVTVKSFNLARRKSCCQKIWNALQRKSGSL